MLKNAQILKGKLAKAKNAQFPLVFVVPGSGQIARYAMEGGAHFLMILNSGIYRSSGVSSLGSYLPFGNANEQVEELLRRQILPRSPTVPLVAGVLPNDLSLSTSGRLERLAGLGVAGITNWPVSGLVDGKFGEAMALNGFNTRSEADMLGQAREQGFATFGFAVNTEDAVILASAGVDAIVLTVGWTQEIGDIFEKADRIEATAVQINNTLGAVRETGRDPVYLIYGGPVLLPEDSATLYQRTGVHGYGGGSAFERIPVAKLVVDTVRKFVAVPKRPRAEQVHDMAGCMVGVSPVMVKLSKLIRRVAPYDVSICIEGESGVGKEIVGAEIHRLSRRRSQSLITLNCGAIPDTLLESEFFGHEKGAFTGAVNRRLGKFELADGGTLFLDEVVELSPKAQVSLLRVLQQKEITRVGGEKSLSVDPRIICATHRNLKDMVDQGLFRADLYFRLNNITIVVPPLRHRVQDIPALVDKLLAELALQFDRKVIGISQGFMNRLMRHSWPGNVRELKHVLSRAIILEDGTIIRGTDFIPDIGIKTGRTWETRKNQIRVAMKSTEANLIINALRSAGGNKTKAAALLGISRKTLYVRMKKVNI